MLEYSRVSLKGTWNIPKHIGILGEHILKDLSILLEYSPLSLLSLDFRNVGKICLRNYSSPLI